MKTSLNREKAFRLPDLRQVQRIWRSFVAEHSDLSPQEAAWLFWQLLCGQVGVERGVLSELKLYQTPLLEGAGSFHLDGIQVPSPESLGEVYEAIAEADKGQGLFYTPAFLVAYLVQRSLGQALQAQQETIETILREDTASADKIAAVQVCLEAVKSWRVVDPACGCGIFLLYALRAFHHFYKSLESRLEAYWGSDFPEPLRKMLPHWGARYAFTYQLYGVDLDPLAMALTEWSLLQEAERLDQAMFSLCPQASNLAVGNALAPVEEYSVHAAQHRQSCQAWQYAQGGEVRFLQQKLVLPAEFAWEACFPEVSAWQFVLGNPPYISEVRQQAERFAFLREQSRISQYYRAKMDLCDAFVFLSLGLLAPGGQMALVLPEYWTHRAGSRGLREQLWTAGNVREFWTFPEASLFPRASGHHSSLLLFEKEMTVVHAQETQQAFLWGQGIPVQAEGLKTGAFLFSPTSGSMSYGEPFDMEILAQLAQLPEKLLQATEIQQGLVIPQGNLRCKDWERLPEVIQAEVQPGAGIFVLAPSQVSAMSLSAGEQACLRPYYPPHPFRAFQGFGVETAPAWIIYGDVVLKKLMIEAPEGYPVLRKHLEKFQSINTSSNAPYGLHRPRQPVWFEDSQKIMGLRQTDFPCFAMVPQAAYVNESFYILCPDEARLPRAGVLAILNSTLAWFWFSRQKHKGHQLQIDKEVLLAFPAPSVGALSPAQIACVQGGVEGLMWEDDIRVRRQLDAWVYQCYQLHPDQVQRIEQLRWGEGFHAQWDALTLAMT